MSETAIKNKAPASESAAVASNVGETAQSRVDSKKKKGKNKNILYGESFYGKEIHCKKKRKKFLKGVFSRRNKNSIRNISRTKILTGIVVVAFLGMFFYGLIHYQSVNNYSNTPPSVSLISNSEIEFGTTDKVLWKIDDLSSPETKYKLTLDGDIVDSGKFLEQSYPFNYSAKNLGVGRHYFKLSISDNNPSYRISPNYRDYDFIIDVINRAPILSYSSPTTSFEYDSDSILQWDTSDSSIEAPSYEILASAPYVNEENLEYFSEFKTTEFGGELCYILSSGELYKNLLVNGDIQDLLRITDELNVNKLNLYSENSAIEYNLGNLPLGTYKITAHFNDGFDLHANSSKFIEIKENQGVDIQEPWLIGK